MKKRKIRPAATARVFRRFLPYLSMHKRTLIVAGVCTLGVTITELLRPWPIKFIFDHILFDTQSGENVAAGLPDWLQGTYGMLAMCAMAILAIALFNGLFAYGQAYLTSSVGQRVVAAVRQQLYVHIQRLSHSFHDTSRTGDLLARLTGDILMLREMMVNATVYVADRMLLLIGMLLVMLWMDWQLTLVALVVLPLLAVSCGYFVREIKGATKRQRKHESEIANVMTEKISAIKVVQAFAREAYEEEQFSRTNSSSVTAGLRATRLTANLNRIVQVILAVGTAAVISFGVLQVQAGLLTPGDLLVFTAYLSSLYKPVRKLASLTSRVAKASVCAERVLAILDTPPEIVDKPNAIQAPPFKGRVHFDQVGFAYLPGHPVLDDVTLEVKPGEKLALIGESGSGKSTLASLMLRFYEPTTGRVEIDGVDVSDYTLNSLREQIAVVMQESVLFNGTIRENIGYGNLEASEEEIVRAAKGANAHDFIEALPDGYDTVIGERGSTLSGGQRQRLAIARAIVRNAPILILDEPTASLDSLAQLEVQEALQGLMADRTCIMITHDLAWAAQADRVICVSAGRIEEIDIGELAELRDSALHHRRSIYRKGHSLKLVGGGV